MTDQNIVPLYEAESIIERDAIVDFLAHNGIDAAISERDMKRKISGGTIDLTLGGYSVVSGGYTVFVPEHSLEEAKAVLNRFFESNKVTDVSENLGSSHISSFAKCAIFSLFMPVVFHGIGAYHMIKALQKKEKLNGSFYVSLLIFAFTGATSILVGYTWLKEHFG